MPYKYIKYYFFLFLLVVSLTASAANPFYNIRDFGAKGDGTSLDTKAINDAIDAASNAGGGTVYFPAGTYLSFSIHLKSHISLFLDAGCVLLAADSAANGKYDDAEPNPFDQYQDYGHSHWHNSLIWGADLQDIAIIGTGLINGTGLRRNASARRPWGNKAIALKLCRNVLLRDFTIINGGHFGILATGVDNFTVDNLRMDTNRDGMDIDGCSAVRVSNCTVNSPWDDAICLKSSYALGYAKPTQDVTITNCQVSGYDLGTLYNGTYKRDEWKRVPDKLGPTGRIKFGTESNGGFKNITISNCVFEYCRGLALEAVDGALLEDVSITNITMKDIVNAPIFLRLGARMRGPVADSANGALRRVMISNVLVYNADSHFAVIISGVPHKIIEDVALDNIRIYYRQMDSSFAKIPAIVPENEKDYPEPARMGIMPAYGFFIRHVNGIRLNNIEVSYLGKEIRPAIWMDDVQNAGLFSVRLQAVPGKKMIVLNNTGNFSIRESESFKNKTIKKTVNQSF
ncbi:MAG: glycoside hydrolase family 28 protein [Bacteroidota bacterium]|nr:glycoside hydrolase family 28 protein [Bacteroidota bacterium]